MPENDDSEQAMNTRRAEWARAAVHAFAAQTGQDHDLREDDDLNDSYLFDEIVGDLICDLGHLATAHGHEFSTVLEHGVGRWLTERASAEIEQQT